MSLGGSDAGDGDGDEDVEHQIEALVAQANRLEQVLRLHSTRVDAAFMVEDTARNTQRHPANSARSRGGGADAGARRSGVKPPNARRGKTTNKKKKKKKRRVGRNTGATGAPTVAADRLAMQVDAGTAAADAADAAAELAADCGAGSGAGVLGGVWDPAWGSTAGRFRCYHNIANGRCYADDQPPAKVEASGEGSGGEVRPRCRVRGSAGRSESGMVVT